MKSSFFWLCVCAFVLGACVWLAGCAAPIPAPYHRNDSGRVSVMAERDRQPESEWEGKI